MRLTGLSPLNGGTVGIDSAIAILYRADGTPVAQSAAAGAVTSGANAFQDLAFTSVYLATGPARYWVGLSLSGTTTRFRTIAANSFIGQLGSSALSTFNIVGTANLIGGVGATLTTALPTTLIADTAPILCAY